MRRQEETSAQTGRTSVVRVFDHDGHLLLPGSETKVDDAFDAMGRDALPRRGSTAD